MKDTLLEARDIHVAYGKIEAVAGVALRVARGQIVTVIGPNGAGKSSLLNAIMGLVPCSGGLSLAGADIARLAVEDRVALGMCLVPESRELFTEMSVLDNLILGTYARFRKGERNFDADIEGVYDLFPRLRERKAQRAGTLSGGERQMLAIGRALMARPTLLMLDEPSLGLAPRIVREILRVVVSLRERGVSLLIVEQNARAALQIADYGYVIEGGRVVLEGPAAELQADANVVATYLGTGGSKTPLPPGATA
ncbi:ABC transporter ATP-binding protein [Bradyrhizobium sp. CCH5-F6]|jgi:branched-chain amino acid transport system ATP-binding protein|uniref:ABC transporter ATP-binding protein n=1 Tax=Bradyrhizobium sp. CCH5-F6 TaxID=1768753 RepID=UPI00076A2C7A|nr:ABC transporter ATP-binding protein [Bradyrhizobium sp. CCH5-F6]